jgi:hypothetical protein
VEVEEAGVLIEVTADVDVGVPVMVAPLIGTGRCCAGGSESTAPWAVEEDMASGEDKEAAPGDANLSPVTEDEVEVEYVAERGGSRVDWNG